MKKIVSLLLILTTTLIVGCQNDLPEYEVETGLYFSVQRGENIKDSSKWAHYPDTPISFLDVKGDETTCNIKVMTFGEVKNYDRSFICTIDKDSTTAIEGVDYEFIEKSYVVKAGTHFAYIPLKVFKTENIAETEKVIGLKLLPNEHFKSLMPVWYPIPSMYDKLEFNSLHHAIRLSNFLTQPPFWEGRAENGIETSTWGLFSVEKFNLMCELCNLSYGDFTTANMPTARKNMVKEVMARHLQNLFNNYPTTQPIKEKDGRLMWVSGCSWKSTVGQPWVPAV